MQGGADADHGPQHTCQRLILVPIVQVPALVIVIDEPRVCRRVHHHGIEFSGPLLRCLGIESQSAPCSMFDASSAECAESTSRTMRGSPRVAVSVEVAPH